MKYYNLENTVLCELYDILLSIADEFPDKDFKKYSKKQRQNIFDSIAHFYEKNSAIFSENNKLVLDPHSNFSFENLCKVLKNANKTRVENESACYEEWICFSNQFDKLTKEAILRFIEDYYSYDVFHIVNETKQTYLLVLPCTDAYLQFLRLVNPIVSDNYNPNEEYNSNAEIDILNSKYRIFFVQGREIVTIEFFGIELETTLFDYTQSDSYNCSIWSKISQALKELEDKNITLGKDFLNQKEQRLCILSKYDPIHRVSSNYYPIDEDEKAKRLFISYASQVGNDKVIKLAEKYCHKSKRNDRKICNAIVKELEKSSSEPLARLILNDLSDAASSYIREVDFRISMDTIIISRNIVSRLMHENGYEGDYPCFKKMSSLKGVNLLNIDGQPIIVANEKNMASMINCSESNLGVDNLIITFSVSTVFLKKDEIEMYNSLDGYSGFFKSKFKRRARTVYPMFTFEGNSKLTYELEIITMAAMKIAECKKLSKNECSNILNYNLGPYGWLSYLYLFIFAGVVFGALFCSAMFIFDLLLGLPFTSFSLETMSFAKYFRAMLLDFPWWQMFLFCVVGFGAPITLLTAISKRRG